MGANWYPNIKAHLQPLTDPRLPPDGGVLSSVMVAIGWNEKTGRDEIVLTKRPLTVATHKGQVCFPGGVREESDPDLLATALRESLEEVGMRDADLEVLGRLSPVRTRFNVWIVPWVARVKLPYPFVVNADEVDRVLFLPVDQLIEEGLKPVRVAVDKLWVQSQGIYISEELVWGATASMLSELREILRRVESLG